MFLKDSDGKKSLTVTVSMITFAVVMIKVLFAGTKFSIGTFDIDFGDIRSDEIAALLAPTLGAYSFRKYTDKKFNYEDAEPALPGEEGAA